MLPGPPVRGCFRFCGAASGAGGPGDALDQISGQVGYGFQDGRQFVRAKLAPAGGVRTGLQLRGDLLAALFGLVSPRRSPDQALPSLPGLHWLAGERPAPGRYRERAVWLRLRRCGRGRPG